PKIWLSPKYRPRRWQIRDELEQDPKTKVYFYEITSKNTAHFFDQRRLLLQMKKSYTTYPLSIRLTMPYFSDSKWQGLEGDFAYRMQHSPNFALAIQRKIENPPATFFQVIQSKKTYKQILFLCYEWLLKKSG